MALSKLCPERLPAMSWTRLKASGNPVFNYQVDIKKTELYNIINTCCLFIGNQPLGYMTLRTEYDSLPGYEDCGTIVMTYNMFGGFQGVVESIL